MIIFPRLFDLSQPEINQSHNRYWHLLYLPLLCSCSRVGWNWDQTPCWQVLTLKKKYTCRFAYNSLSYKICGLACFQIQILTCLDTKHDKGPISVNNPTCREHIINKIYKILYMHICFIKVTNKTLKHNIYAFTFTHILSVINL